MLRLRAVESTDPALAAVIVRRAGSVDDGDALEHRVLVPKGHEQHPPDVSVRLLVPLLRGRRIAHRPIKHLLNPGICRLWGGGGGGPIWAKNVLQCS